MKSGSKKFRAGAATRFTAVSTTNFSTIIPIWNIAGKKFFPFRNTRFLKNERQEPIRMQKLNKDGAGIRPAPSFKLFAQSAVRKEKCGSY